MAEERSAAEHSGKFLRYTLFQADAAWRRQPRDVRCAGRAEFAAAIENCSTKVETYAYSTVGLKAEGDLMLWQMGYSLEALQESTAALLQTGLGQYLRITRSLLGIIRPSHYVKKQTSQEQAISQHNRLKYLIAYPFVKTIDWYLMKREARQGMMNEHIRVGHEFASVRQILAYSFGVDDQEFIVTYETEKLDDFQDLVMALRDTEARRYTLRDTPIFVGIYRPLEATLELLG